MNQEDKKTLGNMAKLVIGGFAIMLGLILLAAILT